VTPFIGTIAQTSILTGSSMASFTVTGLTNGTTYRFRVAAVNSVGTGASSTNSNAATPATVPGAPTNVVATAGNGQASLTWSAPASNGGSAIGNYRVTPFIGSTAQAPILTGSAARTFTVTGLINGTSYRFRVAAVNSVGTGANSAASNSITPNSATVR
jgi:predicted phage tail protein